MLVAVYGSWYPNRSGFQCKGTPELFHRAGEAIGKLLADLRYSVVITSFQDDTIDRYVFDGYVAQCSDPAGSSRRPVIFIRFDPAQQDGPGDRTLDEFDKVTNRYPRLVRSVWAPPGLRFDRHLTGINMADFVLTVGGADHTFMAAGACRLAGKPLLPVGSFGGASEKLLAELLRQQGVDATRGELLGSLTPLWGYGVCDGLRGLLSDLPVVVIHGRPDDYLSVEECIKETRRFRPLRMAAEQGKGAELLTVKWESTGEAAIAAIAVLTPDDIGCLAGGGNSAPRARQNVWLEIGWIWGRFGRRRLLLLVRKDFQKKDVEFPSDLWGVEYQSYEKSPKERSVEIGQFLEQLV